MKIGWAPLNSNRCYNDYNLYLQSDPSASRAVSTGDRFVICKRDHPCTGTHTVARQLQLTNSTTGTSTSEVGGKIGKNGAEVNAKISSAIAIQNSVSATESQTDTIPISFPTDQIPAGQFVTGSSMQREIPYTLSGIGTKSGISDFISNGTAKIKVTTVCWQLNGQGPCLN